MSRALASAMSSYPQLLSTPLFYIFKRFLKVLDPLQSLAVYSFLRVKREGLSVKGEGLSVKGEGLSVKRGGIVGEKGEIQISPFNS